MLPPTSWSLYRKAAMYAGDTIRAADSCILQPGPQLQGHNQIVELMARKPCLVRAWSIR